MLDITTNTCYNLVVTINITTRRNIKMKKILIIGSNGKEGNLIATEAKNRGFLVMV